MNDAHSQRRDTAGAPGPDGRPEDPYAPYGPSAQGPYGVPQYRSQTEPYGPQPRPGSYQQDGYGQDPYGGAAGGYIPQQGRPDTGGYATGGYGTGQYPTGEYQTGQWDTGQYASGQYPAAGPGAGQEGTGTWNTGEWDTGQHATGRFQTQPYQTGQYPSGEYQTGQYPAGGYQTGQYPTGQWDGGPSAAGAGITGEYPASLSQDPAAAPPEQPRVPRQNRPSSGNPYDELAELDDEGGAGLEEARREAGVYRTEQFSFVDDGEDEDVIDWLKFAETRTERRDERRRRARNRLVALSVVLVLALLGGVGYLWQQGKLPFAGAAERSEAAPAAAQKRDVIVVHLMELEGGKSSTALLVNNETTGKGTTVLLPNSLAITTDDGESTTLGNSVDSAGAGPTRDGLSALLGADIKGTWRLDTPFLELLVESVGGIQVDTDSTIKGTGKDKDKTIVAKGEKERLNGIAAVAYATHRAKGEPAEKQLARFGQVIESVLKKMPSTAEAATSTVESLGQVPDPSLPESELGATLAPLAEEAKTGEYQTVALPVQPDGTLDEKTTRSVVRDILGGTVKNTDPGAAPSVRVQNATGRDDAAADAKVTLVNSGYTVVSGGTAKEAVATSRVEYFSEAQAKLAQEVAQTLGLPKSAVRKAADSGQGGQIQVVLGKDFKG